MMGKDLEKLSAAQIRKLFVLARELDMDEEDLRGLACNLTGSDSISGMTKVQASRLIDYLIDKSRGDYRPRAASKQQLYLIKKLAAELGWGDNPKRLAGFMKRAAGVENERWLDAGGAWRVIEGLKKMLGRINSNTQLEKSCNDKENLL